MSTQPLVLVADDEQRITKLVSMALTDEGFRVVTAAGGEEAALFAGDLFRMYSHYAEKHGLKIEVMDSRPSELKGFKEIVFAVEGDEPYRYFRFESGVHRVQRVP